METRQCKTILSLLMLFCLIITVFPQDNETESILVMLATDVSDGTEDQDILEIINNALSIELHIHDFAIAVEKMRNTDRLVSIGRKESASYLIQSLYSLETDKLAVHFKVIRISDETILYSKDFESPISLEMDSALNSEISEIILSIVNDIDMNPTLVTKIKPVEEEEDPLSVRFRHFTISAGLSPFFTTGQASTYFSVGILPKLHGQYRIELNDAYLGLGLIFSMNYSNAEGSASTSEIILLSAGPEFRFGFVLSRRFEAFIGLNGGMTMFLLNQDNQGFQHTFVPFMSGGLGLNVHFSELFGMFISADYSIYFENSVFITGFSPYLGICFSL